MVKYDLKDERVANFITFLKTFESYRWYKPLIEGILALIFWFIMGIAIVIISYVISIFMGSAAPIMPDGGYDTMDTYTPVGVVLNLGSVAIMLPALFWGISLTKSRPFSSVTSSRGGFNFGVLKMCLIVAFVVCGIPTFLMSVFDETKGDIRFTLMGFIFCTVLVPLQCMAEEYFFRGFIMQTIGAWTNSIPIAIIGQTVVFALLHPYNSVGVIVVAADAICFGILAYMTNGLEAGIAYHIINNIVAFYLAGFGLTNITSDVDPIAIPFNIGMLVIYLLILAVIGGFTGVFDKIPEKKGVDNK